MSIFNKIIGGVVWGLGLAVWYIDCLIFVAMGALTAWIADAIGITGNAVIGLQVVGWIVILGTMISIFIFGLGLIYSGFKLITGD
jgi:hypothetical protein